VQKRITTFEKLFPLNFDIFIRILPNLNKIIVEKDRCSWYKAKQYQIGNRI